MKEFDLKELTLSAGPHNITVVAKASGYSDSPPSNEVSYVVESSGTPGLTYKPINNDTEYEVSDYTGTDTEVIIPSMYNGLPVTSIGSYAFFENNSLVSVTIPDSITSIGDSAFAFCLNIESIIIPNSVTSIGTNAFIYSGLTSMVIPNSVTSMGATVFDCCGSLKTIHCEAESKPSGWDDSWNAYILLTSTYYYDVIWGHGVQEETYTIAAGTYVFNENVVCECFGTTPYTADLNFTSNSLSFTKITVIDNDEIVTGSNNDHIKYDTKTVYMTDDGWDYLHPNYQIITLETPQVVSQEFYTWFIENAQPQIQAGTYVFKEELSTDYGGRWFALNFNCDGVSYVAISDRTSENNATHIMKLKYFTTSSNGTYVYFPPENGNGWNDEKYRTIQVTENQVVDKYFYDWFVENTLITFTIEGTTYQAENGMTWAEWCESEYNTGNWVVSDNIIIKQNTIMHIAAQRPTYIIIANKDYSTSHSGADFGN